MMESCPTSLHWPSLAPLHSLFNYSATCLDISLPSLFIHSLSQTQSIVVAFDR